MERISSFHTVQRKRDRGLCSPTGQTPLQASKKLFHENVLGSEKKRWSEEEKLFLSEFSKSGVPVKGADLFWQECAEQMNSRFGSVRTGQMCRSRYKRVKHLFPSAAVSTCQNVEVEVKDQETQTTPILPIGKSNKSTSFWANLSQEMKIDLNATGSTNRLREALSDRFKVNDVSLKERGELLDCLFDKNCDAVSIANVICAIPSLRQAVENNLLMEIEKSASAKCVRSKSSYLYGKDYKSLEEFSFEDLFKEFTEAQPFLLKCLLAISVPTIKLKTCKAAFFQSLVPKLSLIYSTLLQVRFPELSRLQKITTVALMEEHVHEKVFDRLQIMGVTTCYQGATRLMEEIGQHVYDQVIKAVKCERKFRLVGDNCNIKVGVKHERAGQHGTMHNWFASAVILQTNNFSELPNTPQCRTQDLPLTAFLPTMSDEVSIKKDYRFLIGKIAKDFFPNLSFLYRDIDSNILGKHSKFMTSENLVVPLEVLPLNEQKYSDVVQILDHYEDTLEQIYQEAGKQMDSVHIGGDQLTRERFSGAKALRNSHLSEKERLYHLYPIGFELWHTLMNFLSLIYDKLFDENCFQQGTLNAAKILLSRKTVNKDVKHHYDHDKDFFLSFVRSYIVEGLCHFFGLDNMKDKPTKNMPPQNVNEEWVQETMDKFMENYVFGRTSNATNTIIQETEEIKTTPLQLHLPDGQVSMLYVQSKVKKTERKAEHDRVKHYSHNVLELGLLYHQLIDIIRVPDRDRLIYTLKYLMQVLKASNSRSKYALEILRFLCHQQSSYSLQTAHQMCYGLFVNTEGKVDSHIPADLQMEHLIKKIKKLFKATGPNNIEGSVVKKSRALGGITRLAEHFDASGHVIIRGKKHKRKSAHQDELKIIKQLKLVNPFTANYSRSYDAFQGISAPSTATLSKEDFTAWINYHKTNMAFEYGK